jgi:hypothetical protein
VPEPFGALFAGGPAAGPGIVVLRLLAALAMGGVVAVIYVRTSRQANMGESFPTTLALLAVLIAMVTQVIGDNVARAFSLVGALSIVRFRTVVRDTKDTAYVIFAVVVGMAVGAQNLWVAGIGIAVIGAAAFALARYARAAPEADSGYLLTVRVGLGQDFNRLARATLEQYVHDRQLLSVATARQGAAVESVYEARLKRGGSPEELVKALNLVEGVQDVRMQRRSFEQD